MTRLLPSRIPHQPDLTRLCNAISPRLLPSSTSGRIAVGISAALLVAFLHLLLSPIYSSSSPSSSTSSASSSPSSSLSSSPSSPVVQSPSSTSAHDDLSILLDSKLGDQSFASQADSGWERKGDDVADDDWSLYPDLGESSPLLRLLQQHNQDAAYWLQDMDRRLERDAAHLNTVLDRAIQQLSEERDKADTQATVVDQATAEAILRAPSIEAASAVLRSLQATTGLEKRFQAALQIYQQWDREVAVRQFMLGRLKELDGYRPLLKDLGISAAQANATAEAMDTKNPNKTRLEAFVMWYQLYSFWFDREGPDHPSASAFVADAQSDRDASLARATSASTTLRRIQDRLLGDCGLRLPHSNWTAQQDEFLAWFHTVAAAAGAEPQCMDWERLEPGLGMVGYRTDNMTNLAAPTTGKIVSFWADLAREEDEVERKKRRDPETGVGMHFTGLVTGMPLVVRRNVLRRLGGLDEADDREGPCMGGLDEADYWEGEAVIVSDWQLATRVRLSGYYVRFSTHSEYKDSSKEGCAEMHGSGDAFLSLHHAIPSLHRTHPSAPSLSLPLIEMMSTTRLLVCTFAKDPLVMLATLIAFPELVTAA
ncbi:unnamed protein product [Closterium sp. Yama58-4]|nr:unnamed protein product [Closterium sp. Yama58-4]